MEKAKSNKKVILVGVTVVALAVLLILLVVLVPRISRKSFMKDLLREALSEESTQPVLCDPLPQENDPYGTSAKEVLLEGNDLATVRDGLNNLLQEGFRYARETENVWAWDVFLRVRTAEGNIAYIYFTEDTFYYKHGGVSVVFVSKKVSSYGDFYASLEAIIESK